MNAFHWVYGGASIYVGPGVLRHLRGELDGVRKVVVVTGRTAARASGALADLESLLTEAGVERAIYDRVAPNPPSAQAEDVARIVKSERAGAIIAVGGGSAIDVSKVASAIAVGGGSAIDYIYGRARASPSIPVYAVNLTHGTGSEANRYANLTDIATGDKIGGEVVYPRASFDDPKYTLTMPREQILCTSFDALYHAYESATTAGSPPLAQDISEVVARNVVRSLPLAAREPSSIEHRYWLMYAAMLAGVAIDISPTNLIHAVENFLSGLRPTLPHGCGLAIIGPTLARIVHTASPAQSTRMLRAIDPGFDGTPEGATKVLSSFQESVGFARTLGDYGVDEDLLSTAVRRAFSNEVSASRIRSRLSGLELSIEGLIRELRSLI
ncbi:MAG: iron-containing alcohol dehydrogenase [Conexivisphaera sp.]